MTAQHHHATEAKCRPLIAEASIPGAVMAVIQIGQLDRYVCCGVQDARSPASVDEHTIFGAASLSKPVFAHAVSQLLLQSI